jgi:hypothetical protein
MTLSRESPPEDVTLSRWFFALPEPVPLTHGYTVTEAVGNASEFGADGDPLVTLIVHQVSNEFGRTRGAADALSRVVDSASGLPQPAIAVEDASSDRFAPATQYTVIEAITVTDSPDRPPQGWSGRPQDLPPRADALMRCVQLATDLVRAYRIASEVPYAVPSYERIPSPVLRFAAPGVRERHAEGPHGGEQIRSVGEWSGPQIVMLDHANSLDAATGPVVEGVLQDNFNAWMRTLRSGSPFITWRDRLADANRALSINGDYSQAVVLAATSSEVFLDGLLSLLMWEEQMETAVAAARFEEGKLVKRVTSEFPVRLPGNWNVNGKGALGDWFRATYRLRHRVVHGGYEASRVEAEKAVRAAHELETFAFNRLAAHRHRYPRATLMCLAEAGLAKRGAWNGQIKRFNQEVASTEPNWALSFAAYRKDLVAARLAALGSF